MADNLALTVTGSDGTVYSITGAITNATVLKTSPATPPPVSLEPAIPTSAQTVNMLLSKVWSCKHDTGTPGDANGTYAYPTTAPDKTTNCGEFAFTNIAKGGALYHANVLPDATPYNTFMYEAVEYYVDASNIACAEKDLEQVGPAVGTAKNASYVDMATQLDHYNGTVDITQNQKWQATTVKADPSTRKTGVWYTTRIYVKNIDGKNVQYIGIYLSDTGVYYPLNITVPSQPSEQWGPKLLNQQLQYVGLSAGTVSSTVYIKTLNIHCWKS
jgi:hypothetical protein